MTLNHLGIEVADLYSMELFYRKYLGFEPVYRYVSKNSPGLKTVFLEKDGFQLEFLERPRSSDETNARKKIVPNHISFENQDLDSVYESLKKAPLANLKAPRKTGDGFMELSFEDPEGNIIEMGTRIAPEPCYPIEAVIFDLDGTLIDSEKNYYTADRQFLKTFGIDFTPEMQKNVSGMGNKEFVRQLKRDYGIPGDEEDILRRKNESYMEFARKNTEVFPEMKRYLDKLKAAGYKLAVASGSSPDIITELLETTGLAPNFHIVLSAEAAGIAKGKPAPDVFLATAKLLGVQPHHCAVVEDSKYGVEAAKRAFMKCIAVPYITSPLADAFLMADLLFPKGMTEFDAEKAFEWTKRFR